MGYYVTSAFTVSLNDKHSYFVYFVPGRDPYRRLSTAWINTWVHAHFSEIAQALGPRGVIVSPPTGKNWDDREVGLAWPFMNYSGGEDYFLHGHMPFLLILRSPLQPEMEGNKDGIAINLVKCADERELASVFDTIITGIRSDDWQYIVNNFPHQERAEEPNNYGGWLMHLSRVFELKPNVFGRGVNLNAAMEALGKKWLSGKKSQPKE